jgi:cephalosporin-C deacetylase-like acetyl esterase
MRTDIEFEGHGGLVLRGWLYLPDGASPAAPVPGIVMAHGFSATKEMALDDYAERFCAAGFAVLAYDHRCLGASDGEPRQVINPWAQARDYRYAIGRLAACPEADRDRIGLWGSSFSGGQVLVLGAVDERVRAVVASVPFAGIGAGYDDQADVDARFAQLRDALTDLSGNGPADATEPPMGPLAVVHEPGQPEGTRVFLGQPESAEWFLAFGRRPGSTWRNEVWLRRAFGTELAFDPGVAVGHLQAPVLFVVATDDTVAPTAVALDAYERAPEPKQLELVVGHHFTGYAGEALEHCAAVEIAFFQQHL